MTALTDGLAAALPPEAAILLDADAAAAPAEMLARARDFAATLPAGQEGLVITLLHACPPGLDALEGHAANAMLWAFTRQAARTWAPRRIRVNAIGLGTSVFGPFEPPEQAGRAAGDLPAAAATLADIARTVRFIAACPSITGQIIRLG